MKTKIIVLSAAVLGILAPVASAQQSTVNGAAGGAVTGAIVGGPVGAAVGGVVGAVAGTAIDPPPQRVVSYVETAPAPSARATGRHRRVRVQGRCPRDAPGHSTQAASRCSAPPVPPCRPHHPGEHRQKI